MARGRPCLLKGQVTLGSSLPGCVKVYLPPPAGKFGIVFEIDRQAGNLVLAYLAFGVRHHPLDSDALTVYQLAHQRLNESAKEETR